MAWTTTYAPSSLALSQTYSPENLATFDRLAATYQSPQQRLMSQYQGAYDEARAANEQRYQDILSLLGGVGEQELSDIRTSWSNRATGAQQDLVSRGLTGTTVAPTLMSGYEQMKNADLGRARDRQAMLRAGFMERRTDAYPDFGMMASLLQQYGQSGGGGRYSLAAAQARKPFVFDWSAYGGSGGGRRNRSYPRIGGTHPYARSRMPAVDGWGSQIS